MKKLVKLVKMNNLQYNANRDPEVFRRAINEEFRIQALLDGEGTAKARFVVEGETKCEKSISLPGTFECRLAYDTAGTRIGTLIVEGNGETFSQDLRLDTREHAWIG